MVSHRAERCYHLCLYTRNGAVIEESAGGCQRSGVVASPSAFARSSGINFQSQDEARLEEWSRRQRELGGTCSCLGYENLRYRGLLLEFSCEDDS